jgi:hypothetical protein
VVAYLLDGYLKLVSISSEVDPPELALANDPKQMIATTQLKWCKFCRLHVDNN